MGPTGVIYLALTVAYFLFSSVTPATCQPLTRQSQLPAHYRLEDYLMTKYNSRLIPRRDDSPPGPVQIHFSIGLYQIIEVNEPQQWLLLNCWVVERWMDDLLYWEPSEFMNLTDIVMPRELVWAPDTTLYNSVVMDDAQSRRIQSVKITTVPEKKTALVEMLYPTLHKFSCMLNLRYFPFDIQTCAMTFGSWIHDNHAIDYYAHYYPFGDNLTDNSNEGFGVEHCIENEAWNILRTEVVRHEVKFKCCANNYTLLEFYLVIQRKPLFYFINLIIPSLMISMISLVGFFSSPTVNDIREEKISMGITTLLSMSILIFMVSDQMPSTSSFIPLIGWFYTSMIILVSGGTLAGSFVIYVQKKGIIGERPSTRAMRISKHVGALIWMQMPLLMNQAYELKARQDKIAKQRQMAAAAASALHKRLAGLRRKSIVQLWQKLNGTPNEPQNSRPSVYYPTLGKGIAAMASSMGPPAFARPHAASNTTESNPKTKSSLEEPYTDDRVSSVIDEEDQDCDNLPNDTGSNLSLEQLAALVESMERPHGTNAMSRRTSTDSIADPYRLRDQTNGGGKRSEKEITRSLAQIEYDWIAAVVERLFLIIFCLLFFLMCFGINGIGLLHWNSIKDEVPNR
ncbi:neurotransmitter-gated ion-channel ligand binding domain-containing protein [Ditylenchus destructor]|uniref:Neurotransmitter-gated ion-channel ligand binding domain-containing protein n=1 Tax=Ditylenchus destructor TaxID=166010 RepID=A0AAD4RAS2_9BILA|nr:neurotransmitter-gated ion-channel ligand binding domain-containing protein [Ditylenchus destructor]